MKRVIATLLILMCFAVPATAQMMYDLDSMNLEELLQLHRLLDAKIQEELDCSLTMDQMYPGTYRVGKDIAEGRYLFTETEEHQYFVYFVYANEEDFRERKHYSKGSSYYAEPCYVKLDDGMILFVDQGLADVQLAPKAEWEP